MPKLKRKSVSQRVVASRMLMRRGRDCGDPEQASTSLADGVPPASLGIQSLSDGGLAQPVDIPSDAQGEQISDGGLARPIEIPSDAQGQQISDGGLARPIDIPSDAQNSEKLHINVPDMHRNIPDLHRTVLEYCTEFMHRKMPDCTEPFRACASNVIEKPIASDIANVDSLDTLLDIETKETETNANEYDMKARNIAMNTNNVGVDTKLTEMNTIDNNLETNNTGIYTTDYRISTIDVELNTIEARVDRKHTLTEINSVNIGIGSNTLETNENNCDTIESEDVLSKEDDVSCMQNIDYDHKNKSDHTFMYTATPVIIGNKTDDQEKNDFYGNILHNFSGNFVFGSFSQSDKRFCEDSRGSQCAINALCSFVHANDDSIISSQNIDDILLEGDLLYKDTISKLKERNLFKSRHLTFEELPDFVCVKQKTYSVNKYDVVSGVCTQQFGTTVLPTLHQGLYTAFQQSSSLLIMIGAICSSAFKKDDQYFFFDSHCHDQNGLHSFEGQSVLASFYTIDDLVSYLYALYDSMLIDLTSQFEILPVHILQETSCTFEEKYTSCEIITSNKLIYVNWKTVKNKNLGKDENCWETVSNKRHVKLKQGNRHTEKRASDIYGFGSTVVGQYIKDQKFRRKIYQQLYKQKQRQSADYKLQDKKYTVNSMRKARQSAEYKQKENEMKRNTRQLKENKSKERQTTLTSKRKARKSADYKQKENETRIVFEKNRYLHPPLSPFY